MKIGKLRNCSRICGPWFGSELSKNSQSLWVVAHTTTLKPDPEGRQSFRGLFLSSIRSSQFETFSSVHLFDGCRFILILNYPELFQLVGGP